ncbi:YceI family protein [Chryseobacterium sp. ISL-80]|nr:YceI family protein [Chryseobacterium sp. ISL-80]
MCLRGFEAEAKVNRQDFGLTWNAARETGGVLVGKDIKIKGEPSSMISI